MEKRNLIKSTESSTGDGKLWKIGSKVLLGIVVAVLALSVMQCSVKKPEAPEWNTQLTVPLINRTYMMEELIEKASQDGLQMDTANNIIYSMSYDVDTIGIDNADLSVPNSTYSVDQELGPIDLTPPQLAPVSTDLENISALSAILPTVPAVAFTLINTLPAFSSFETATVDNGQMLVIISNQLGINLDSLSIQIYDLDRSQVLDAHNFPGGLLAGSIDTAVFVLDGKTISNSLEATTGCRSEATSIVSASGKYISTEVKFASGLTVSSASAQVPALSPIASAQTTVLDPTATDVIYRGTLSAGSLEMTITNNTALDATLTIGMPDMDMDGVKYQQIEAITAGASRVISRDISGYDLLPIDSTLPQSVNFAVQVDIPGSGSNFVNVSSTDDFSVTADLTGLVFESISGVFAATDATFDPVSEPIDIPEGFDGFALVSSIITLKIENSVDLAGDLVLELSDGNGKTLDITDSILAGTPQGPTTTTITIVDSTFLSPLPDSIIFSGSATFGDGITVGTIGASDYLIASVTVTAPIEAVISETVIETDIESETIDTTDIGTFTDRIIEGRFVYTITNHMPLGASVRIMLGGDTTQLVGQDNQVIPEYTLGGVSGISVPAAPTIDGIVPADSISTTGEQTILITNADLDFLDNDPLFIGSEITLLGSGGESVKLTANDYITISGYVVVDYRFDGEF